MRLPDCRRASIVHRLSEAGKLSRLGPMGHVPEYSCAEVSHFVEASGLAQQSVDYRRDALLRLDYRLAPWCRQRDIIIVVRKCSRRPLLQPRP